MNAIMPKKASQNLSQRPLFPVTPYKNSVVQEMGLTLQQKKTALTAVKNGSCMIAFNSDFAEVVVVYIFCMFIHFIRCAGNGTIKGFSFGQTAFVSVRNSLIQRQKILRRL